MARKIVNRKEKRAEVEAAEAAEKADAPKKKAKRKPAKRKPRKKAAENVRMKLFWGVFSQSLKRVALYEFDQRKEAMARAEKLGKGGKSPHFVQRVKEVIEEV